MQVPHFECLSFDPISLLLNDLVTSEEDVGGCGVVQALVATLVNVMIGEGLSLIFEVSGWAIVLQQSAVLQGPLPPLDLALSLWMAWRAARLLHVLARPAINACIPSDTVRGVGLHWADCGPWSFRVFVNYPLFDCLYCQPCQRLAFWGDLRNKSGHGTR